MPVWETPGSSSEPFQRVGPASIKRKKKRDDDWWDVPGNFLTDVKDTAVGMALAVPRAAGHITHDIGSTFSGDFDYETDDAAWGMVKAIKDDYKHTYGPLLGWGGDFDPGLTYSRIKQHPLGPVLDVLALVSGGASLVGKGAKIAATSGSARGAKLAGLESRGLLFDDAGKFNLDAVRDLVPKRDNGLGELVPDPKVIRDVNGVPEFSELQYYKDYIGGENSPRRPEIAEDLIARVKTLGGVMNGDEVLLPRAKRVTGHPDGDKGGYIRHASPSIYTRGRQNAVDKFAAKHHNFPGIGASGVGARRNARVAGDGKFIRSQVLTSRLKRDQDRIKGEDPEGYRALPYIYPSSRIDSRREAREAQVAAMERMGPEMIPETELEAHHVDRRAGLENPELGDQSIRVEHEYLNSPEFRGITSALRGDWDNAKLAVSEIAAIDPVKAKRFGEKWLDPEHAEGYKGMVRDMISAYYTEIGPNMMKAQETGRVTRAAIKGKPVGRGNEARRQRERSIGEEQQFRELADNPEDASLASIFDDPMLSEMGIDLRQIRKDADAEDLGAPILSHAIARESKTSPTGSRGRPGQLPDPNTPEFRKNSYITNQFALNQMNGPRAIVRALEHAALARESTGKFRSLISQAYRGKTSPGKGWVRLDEEKALQFKNGVEDVLSFLEDDFTLLSGGTQISMVDDLASTLKKMAKDLDSQQDIWVPSRAMNTLFTSIKREQNMAGNLYSNATRIWRNLTLGLRPQWMINNMVGNLTLLAMEHGIWNSMRSLAVSYRDQIGDQSISKVIDEKAPQVLETGQYREGMNTSKPTKIDKAERLADEGGFEESLKGWLSDQEPEEAIGDTMAKMSIIKSAGQKGKRLVSGEAGLRFNSKWIDDPARRAALLANLAPHIKQLRARAAGADGKKMTNAEAIARLLENDEIKDMTISKTMRDMIDYRDMTPGERKWLRGTFPFYAWLRGMNKRYMQLLVEKPELMAVIQHVAEISEQDPDFDERYPEWMRRMAKIDPGTIAEMIRGENEGGTPAINLSAMNIMQTPADVATLINTLFYGDKDDLAATGSIANYSNPFLKAMLETITGKNLFTGNQLAENVTDPEMSPATLLARRTAGAFPIVRDAMEYGQVEDPEYKPMSEPGQLGYGRFFQPMPNTLVDDALAMESRTRDEERSVQEIGRAAEIEKRKKKAKADG